MVLLLSRLRPTIILDLRLAVVRTCPMDQRRCRPLVQRLNTAGIITIKGIINIKRTVIQIYGER